MEMQRNALLLSSYDKLTKKLWNAKKGWKLTYKNLRKILGILKLWTYDKVTTNLGKTYEDLRKNLGKSIKVLKIGPLALGQQATFVLLHGESFTVYAQRDNQMDGWKDSSDVHS